MQSAASITNIQGKVYVERGGTRTLLTADTPIHADDTIVTDNDATVSLRFADGAEVNIGAASVIEIAEFVYTPTEEAFNLNLVSGMMRSISGAIVERNPDAFSIGTPRGTIGIRGTTTVHSVTSQGEVHAVVSIGEGHTVVVTGNAGQRLVLTSDTQGVAFDTSSSMRTITLSHDTLQNFVNSMTKGSLTPGDIAKALWTAVQTDTSENVDNAETATETAPDTATEGATEGTTEGERVSEGEAVQNAPPAEAVNALNETAHVGDSYTTSVNMVDPLITQLISQIVQGDTLVTEYIAMPQISNPFDSQTRTNDDRLFVDQADVPTPPVVPDSTPPAPPEPKPEQETRSVEFTGTHTHDFALLKVTYAGLGGDDTLVFEAGSTVTLPPVASESGRITATNSSVSGNSRIELSGVENVDVGAGTLILGNGGAAEVGQDLLVNGTKYSNYGTLDGNGTAELSVGSNSITFQQGAALGTWSGVTYTNFAVVNGDGAGTLTLQNAENLSNLQLTDSAFTVGGTTFNDFASISANGGVLNVTAATSLAFDGTVFQGGGEQFTGLAAANASVDGVELTISGNAASGGLQLGDDGLQAGSMDFSGLSAVTATGANLAIAGAAQDNVEYDGTAVHAGGTAFSSLVGVEADSDGSLYLTGGTGTFDADTGKINNSIFFANFKQVDGGEVYKVSSVKNITVDDSGVHFNGSSAEYTNFTTVTNTSAGNGLLEFKDSSNITNYALSSAGLQAENTLYTNTGTGIFNISLANGSTLALHENAPMQGLTYDAGGVSAVFATSSPMYNVINLSTVNIGAGVNLSTQSITSLEVVRDSETTLRDNAKDVHFTGEGTLNLSTSNGNVTLYGSAQSDTFTLSSTSSLHINDSDLTLVAVGDNGFAAAGVGTSGFAFDGGDGDDAFVFGDRSTVTLSLSSNAGWTTSGGGSALSLNSFEILSFGESGGTFSFGAGILDGTTSWGDTVLHLAGIGSGSYLDLTGGNFSSSSATSSILGNGQLQVSWANDSSTIEIIFDGLDTAGKTADDVYAALVGNGSITGLV